MPNKYNAKRTEVNGIMFASKREAAVYGQLRLRQRAGEIRHLICHPRWPMEVNGIKIGNYTADFMFVDADTPIGKCRVIDVKSKATAKGEAFRLRKKLFEALYPELKLEIWL